MKRTVIAATGKPQLLVAARLYFSLNSGDFRVGKPTITVEGLAGAETVTLTRQGGDIVRNGVIDATNEGSVTAESPGVYGLFKDATAADIKVIVENGL